MGSNVPVAGFPHAVVLDKERLQQVQKSHGMRLDKEDLDLADMKY